MRIPVAREGWPFVAIPGAIALGLALLGRRRLALPFAAGAAASLGFFRDPERTIPVVPNAALAPADGRVTAVEQTEDPFVGPAVRVAIFLSPLDVHVNRAPIAGVVADVLYTPGRFLAAYDPAAGEVNERCTIRIRGESARVAVVQVAGTLARRIVCRVGPGDKLTAGARIGMIRFGSRTDCLMPRGTEVTVQPGDRVTGGVHVIGVLP
ncbi:MAG TPA: phosphatidylserine decarboxylase [Candidatus Tectomicrobia bacterium]|nr:phosphatidylserine decarboxylase [Candidatus Tectomicrobia bacterium]